MTDVMDDPFATPAGVDEDFDPFATSDDVKTGTGIFIPRPPIDVLRDRLVVLVPRKFDAEAKVSEFLRREYNLPETREEWTIDLIVLDGGKMEYEYRSKVQGTENDYEDKTWVQDEFPFEVPNFKASWANIIGSLNKLTASPRPFGLGRIVAGYSASENRKRTDPFGDFRAEEDAYFEKVKVDPKKAGDRPKARWHFVLDESPEARALAGSWWKDAKARGFKVN